MKPKLEFFYDYVSPYSYLADTQLDRLGAEIVYRPMLLGGVMKATGNSPPKSVPAKGSCFWMSARSSWTKARTWTRT